jgi:hypothetical protein
LSQKFKRLKQFFRNAHELFGLVLSPIVNMFPNGSEPRVWSEPVKSTAQVLASENQELLETISERIPHSRKEPKEITGRKHSDLARTLKNNVSL